MKINILLVLAAVFLLCSCGDRSDSRNHPLLVKANTLKGQGKFDDAVKLLNEYVFINPKSAKAHLELASIYNEDLNDPFMAIYHYRQHLNYAKDSQDKDAINRLVFAAEKKYFEVLKHKIANPPVFSDEKKDAKTKDKKAQPAKAQAQTKQPEQKKEPEKPQAKQPEQKKEPAPVAQPKQPEQKKETEKPQTKQTEQKKEPEKPQVKQTEQKKEPAPAAQPKQTEQKKEKSYYVVQKGDSLEIISKKVYGTIKHAEYIHELNKKEISTPMDLQIGQKLLIITPPPQQKEKN